MRTLLAATALAGLSAAFGFTAPAVRASLPARRAAAAGLFGASRVALAGPSLRLSGGAAGLQAAVLDGIKATDIDGKEVDLGKYSSVPAVLVVNLASA